MKKGISTYKAAYETCEEGLKKKGEATSAQLLNWLITNYNIHSLNITPKGITYYLKQQGYDKYRHYQTKPWIFVSKKHNN
jgi:hypothetical protein